MAAPRCATAVVLACAVFAYSVAVSSSAQQSGFAGGSGGGGPLSPSVVATWDAHFEAQVGQQVTDPFAVPLILDLLVLWRGKPGWFDDATLSSGSGGSDGVHQVASRGHALALRFDRRTDTVRIQGQTVALNGANVLLLDDVDNPNGVLVAGTMRMDQPISAGRPAQSGANVDPLAEMIRRAPELYDYLRCDVLFTDPDDPATVGMLRNCAQYR